MATLHSLWDLSFLTRDWTRATARKVLSPNHWTAREFPPIKKILKACSECLGAWALHTLPQLPWAPARNKASIKFHMIWWVTYDFVTLGLTLSDSKNPKVPCLLNNANITPIFDAGFLSSVWPSTHAAHSPLWNLTPLPLLTPHIVWSLPLAKEAWLRSSWETALCVCHLVTVLVVLLLLWLLSSSLVFLVLSGS